MIFTRQTLGFCWICSAKGRLTGEHKIKKSDLKRYPVLKPRFVRVDTGEDMPVQGLNSAHLKFENSICARCNNQTTQQADRSYDDFRGEEFKEIRSTLEGVSGSRASATELDLDFANRIELARYFGKHLGCALGYQRFPIPRRLSKLVLGRSKEACVSLSMRLAPFCWRAESGQIGPLNALGGAFLHLRPGPLHLPFAYQSSYMTDGVQFTVKMRLSMPEAWEHRLVYQRKHGHLVRGFENEEAKYPGLPYDE